MDKRCPKILFVVGADLDRVWDAAQDLCLLDRDDVAKVDRDARLVAKDVCVKADVICRDIH